MGQPIPYATSDQPAGTEEEEIKAEEDYKEDEEHCSEDEEESSDEDAVSEGEFDSEHWQDPSTDGVLTRVLSAAGGGDVDALEQLLGSLSVSINARGPDGDSALHLASVYGHAPCVERLLATGAAADVRDEDEATPLHDAAAGGYLEACRMLFEAAPDTLNASDSDGDTPLHNAARGGHLDVAEFLLQRGADTTARNANFERAVDVAERGSPVRLLLQAACDRTAAATS